MSVFTTTSSPAPELQSPFAGFAGLAAATNDAGENRQPGGVVLDSPFGTGLRSEVVDSGEDVVAELLEALADDEFEDALAQLVDEAASSHLQGKTAWSTGQGSQAGLHSWAESLAQRSDHMLDGVAARLEQEDLTALPARDLDALLASFSVEPEGPNEVAFEQFLGGLLKKAGALVKGVVTVAKKGLAVVSKILPIGALLKKLKGLVRPLLTKVLKAAINRLPAAVRPIAHQVAQKLGIAGEAPVAVATELAEAFDRGVADLMLAPDDIAADGVLAEAAAEAEAEAPDPIGELDTARKELGRRLTELPAGSYPKPEIQQFLPAVLAALPLIKLGITIIGRQRVVDFIAERIADLLRSMVGAEPAKLISRPIVDVGMRLIGLEVPAEAEVDLAAEALASTVESTARRALALPAAVQDDRLLLDAAVQQYFAEAAAAHLPGRLLRADLPERESEHEGGVWVLMPRMAAPRYRFLKYSRPFEIHVSRQTARAVPWSDGGTLESHLLDRGLQQWPAVAEAHLYETLPGCHLGHLRHDDSVRTAAESETGADEVEALTPEIAGLLLGEPGLGRAVHPSSTARFGAPARPGVAPGSRLLKLRLKGRHGRGTAWPRARVVVRADLGAAPPRLTVELRLSERQAQEMLDLLTRAEGPDLPGALRKVQQLHRCALVPRLVRRLMTQRSLALDETAARAAAERLVTSVDAGLSTMLQSQATQLTAAVRQPAQGITITLAFTGVTRESLQGTLPPPTASVAPGWGSSGG